MVVPISSVATITFRVPPTSARPMVAAGDVDLRDAAKVPVAAVPGV